MARELEMVFVYYFIIVSNKKDMQYYRYLFPYLSSHLAECFYHHGVHGIPKGVAATSFPLCKTKMVPPLSLSLLSTQFSRNTMKTSFIFVLIDSLPIVSF